MVQVPVLLYDLSHMDGSLVCVQNHNFTCAGDPPANDRIYSAQKILKASVEEATQV